MKKIILFIIMAVSMATSFAADKKEIKTTVFVTDLKCDHCKKKIMNNIPSLGKGIEEVEVNVKKKEVTVTYDASKNSDENIIKGLASLKVKAQPKK